LGPGALVLSTELVPAPGWRGWLGQRVVRLTAAAERAIEAVEAAELSADRTPLPESRPSPPRPEGPRAGVAARLTAAGLDRTLADAVAARLTDAECRGASEAALKRALAAELSALCDSSPDLARYEVFVGPPGVGKTTTVAKIAAQARARGGTPLALVSTDAQRPGAIEQLRTYAAVLGAPFRSARTPDELSSALAALRHPVLIDTAGWSATTDSPVPLLDVLSRRRGVRTHLVLAADTSAAAARRLLDRFGPARASCAVITRLDEVESAMPLVSVLRERGLRVSYLASGQRVPEDLRRATEATVSAALLNELVTEGRA
jgi:flagellar biosynthesis protein FlhF